MVAQTIDWAGGMIDWKDPTYVAQGNAFKAHVQWVDIQCYSGSDLNLPFVQGNSSSSTNSTKRLRERELWPRAQAINSYIYGSESLSPVGASLFSVFTSERTPPFIGKIELTSTTIAANNSDGQIGVSGSNAGTIINSAYSTGQNSELATGTTEHTTRCRSELSVHQVGITCGAWLTRNRLAAASVIISDGKTKGVKQGIGSGELAKTVVGNWWQRQNTGVVRPFFPLVPGPEPTAPQSFTKRTAVEQEKKEDPSLTSVNRPSCAARRHHHRGVPRRSLPVRRCLHALGASEPTFESPARSEPSRDSLRLDRHRRGRRISYSSEEWQRWWGHGPSCRWRCCEGRWVQWRRGPVSAR